MRRGSSLKSIIFVLADHFETTNSILRMVARGQFA